MDTLSRKIKRNSNLRNPIKRAGQSDHTDLSVSDTCTLRLYVYDMSIIMIYVVVVDVDVVKVGGDEIGTSD